MCSNYVAYGPESPAWMAAITGCCSVTFLIFLICFNHTTIPSGKHSKLSKEKTPSVVDLLFIAAFVLALVCSTLMAIMLRWRRLKKWIPPMLQKEIKHFDLSSTETKNALEEHQVHFGERPNFKDILGKFWKENCGSNVGVLVCGPESMKESVAFEFGVKKTEPCFTFHSLNFTL